MSVLARYYSLQSIHQERGNFRSTKVFDIGDEHAGNGKGKVGMGC